MGKWGAQEKGKAISLRRRERVGGRGGCVRVSRGEVDEEGRLREVSRGKRDGSRVEDVINGGVVGRKTRGGMRVM